MCIYILLAVLHVYEKLYFHDKTNAGRPNAAFTPAQLVARTQLVARNKLRWCKRGITAVV